jgi:hypothetical protein
VEILFGSGLGSGIQDLDDNIPPAQKNSGAYQDDEIDTGIYFTLHDMWIALGFRFGILAIIFFYFLNMRYYKRVDSDGKFAFIYSIISVLCGFFSMAGMLSLFIFLNYYRSKALLDAK